MASARIRDAALRLFGEQGFTKTTVRQVADAADVSPGLVIHHFGSKDGLRAAVDAWFVDFLRQEKNQVLLSGSSPEIAGYVTRHPELKPVMAYLVASLREGGEVADHVFDLMVQVTRELLTASIEGGLMRAVADPEALAPVLVAYSCGATMLADQLARHLGGDDLLDPDVYARYVAASLEVFSQPLFTPGAFLPDNPSPEGRQA